MSRNLIKGNYQEPQDESITNTCVIDNNELVARRIEQLRERLQVQDFGTDDAGEPDDMVDGIEAEQVASLLAEDTHKAEKLLEDAKAEAEQIVAQAQAEAEQLLQKAASDAEQLRAEAVSKAHDEGYQKGMELGEQKIRAKEDALRLREQDIVQKERELVAKYDQMFDELEPRFVDTIAQVYEHVLHVNMQEYKNVIVYLIENTMRKIEGNRNFLIHVCRDDYPLVSMQKKEIQSYAAGAISIEIIEDITLGRNECLIETEGGIFDCGLGTQLAELGKEIRLLSYEGN